MPDITPVQHQSKANGVINFMGGLGAAIALSVGALLDKTKHAVPFYICAAVILISTVVLFVNIREKRDVLQYSNSPNHGLSGEFKKKKTLRQLAVMVKSMKNVLMLLISIFFLFIAFYCVSSFFTLFAQEHLNVAAHVATGKFAFLVGTMLVFALPAGIISDKIGKKKTMLIGIIAMILVFGGINFTKDINVIGYLFIPAGAAWALIIVNAYPFVISMTDTKNIGSYTGFYYFFSSLASLVSPPFIGLLIDKLGYGILFKYSVVGFILALVCILFVKAPKELPAKKAAETQV
jgi:maltose/moltooligosaccharide transporter